ncbi:MAG: VanZ family protein [Nocardioides sp.]|nr:VanZ family protein [Nocardioides sp.]
MDNEGVRRLVAVVLAGYVAVLLYALLTPSAEVPSSSVGRLADLMRSLGAPERILVADRVEFLANVAILVPATALASWLWRSPTWRDWTAYGFVFAGGVEVVQALLLPARSATYVDVVANTLGALGGAALVALARLAHARSSHSADLPSNM